MQNLLTLFAPTMWLSNNAGLAVLSHIAAHLSPPATRHSQPWEWSNMPDFILY